MAETSTEEAPLEECEQDDSIVQAIAPREPRYQLRDGQVASVVLQRAKNCDPRSITAQLLDISRNGAKLSVPICLPFEEEVDMQIEISDLALSLDISARVRWVRPAGDAMWLLGCVFNRDLSDQGVAKLTSGMCLDRRRSLRHEIMLKATVHWELQSDGTPVVLRNLSAGGFCMTASSAGEVGQRLLLHLEKAGGHDATVQAQIEWRLKANKGYLIGCSFLNSYSYASLREAVEETQQKQKEKSQPTEYWMPGPIVGAMTLLALVLPSLLLLPLRAGRVGQPTALIHPAATEQSPAEHPHGDGPAATGPDHRPPTAVAPSVMARPGATQSPSTDPSDEVTSKLESSLRTWTDRTGKYSIVATLVQVERGIVRLRKEDGRISSLPLKKLSEADQQLVREWMAAH